MTGLETLIDITQIEQLRDDFEKERIVDILSSPDGVDPGNKYNRELSSWVTRLMMRAHANRHRHYEIYTIHVDPSVTEETMWNMFMASPQQSADLIRARGNRLHSDRGGAVQVIT